MKILKPTNILEIANTIKNDGIVALPTETVFGVAVSLRSESAIKRLISLKDRGVDTGKVFTLVPQTFGQIEKFATIPENFVRAFNDKVDFKLNETELIIQNNIPGALTVILKRNPEFRNFYYDNFEKIGIRIPDFLLFKNLLPLTGPLLLTSANPRGAKTAKNAREVVRYFGETIDAVVDAKPDGNLPSTVVDLTSGKPVILRQGEVKFEFEKKF